MSGSIKQKIYSGIGRIPADFGQTDPHTPYLFFVPVLALQLYWAFSQGKASWPLAIGPFAAGVALWSLLEYVIHRFAFHAKIDHPLVRPFNASLHRLHHDAPSDKRYIAAPMVLNIPSYMATLALLRLFLGDWSWAVIMGSGLMAAFMAYEWVHYSAHLLPATGSIMRYLKKHHLAHHHADAQNLYGVTTPLWDWAFGTLKDPRLARKTSKLMKEEGKLS